MQKKAADPVAADATAQRLRSLFSTEPSAEAAGDSERRPELARQLLAQRPLLRRASVAYMLGTLADSEDTIQIKSQAEPRSSDASRRCADHGARLRSLVFVESVAVSLL